MSIGVAVSAAGLAALGFAPVAASAASTGDTLTVAGGSSYTYTFNQSPSIEAVANPNCIGLGASPVTISISGPGVVDPILVSAKRSCVHSISLSPSAAEVDTADPAWAGGSPAMNGIYTLTLDNEGRTTTASFTLLIPPATPKGFAVSTSGTDATFSWIANSEPDITGYDVINSAGRTVVDATDACSGGSCSTGPVDLGKSVAGRSKKFSLVAVRSCGTASCSGGAIDSERASTASASFATAPSPTPSANPTSGSSPTSSPTSGAGTGGATGSAQPTASSTSASGSAAKTHKHHGKHARDHGANQALNAPDLPTVDDSNKPLALGKPGGKIAYPAPVVAKKNDASGRTLTEDISSGLSAGPLWKGIAAAAVLLLLAVHLRVWVGREPY